jgi:hypothetical protein
MAIPTPISFWNFDESSGNAADALSVNTLTNNNTVTYSAGKINNGADLESSSSQSFSIADASQTGLDLSGDCSFAGWVKFESFTTDNTLFAKTDGNTTRSYVVRILSSGDGYLMNAECYGDGTTSNRRGANSNAAFTTTTVTWFHFAATFDVDTGAWVFYKDGSVIASTASNAGTVASIYNSSNKFQVGANNYLGTDDRFFDGMIDMFGVWSSTLSATDVSDLYNAGTGVQYPFAASGPTNLKSLNTNVKANIKSYNTNVIANVKSINTNS